MENAGLPEDGDSVLTFPFKYLQDEDSYWQSASLDSVGLAPADQQAAAHKRRDLAVRGFQMLRAELAQGSLETFYQQAARLVRSKEPGWPYAAQAA